MVNFHHLKQRDILSLHEPSSVEEVQEEPELELPLRQHKLLVGLYSKPSLVFPSLSNGITWKLTRAPPQWGGRRWLRGHRGAEEEREALEAASCTRHSRAMRLNR